MLSPQDRLFNTPDVSSSSIEAALYQQNRLEGVIRRFGFYDTCRQTTRDGVEPPIGERIPIPQNQPIVYPLVSEPRSEVKDPSFPLRPARTKTKWHKHIKEPPKGPPRSKIPGAPDNDPYVEKSRDTVGGRKYGAVHLTEHGKEPIISRPPLFKPFYPQRCPLRLPAIQRIKSGKKSEVCELQLGRPRIESARQSAKITSKPNIQTKLPLPPLKDGKRESLRKRYSKDRKQAQRFKREIDFIEWETNNEKFEHNHVLNRHAIFNLPITDHMTHELWEHRMRSVTEEERFRDEISANIKRGVERRLQDFGRPRELHAAPVLDMTFVPSFK